MTDQALRGTLRLKLMSIIIQNILNQKPLDITIDTATLKPVGQYDSSGYCPEAVDIGAGYMRRLQAVLGAQSARKVFPIYMNIFDSVKEVLVDVPSTCSVINVSIDMPNSETLTKALQATSKNMPTLITLQTIQCLPSTAI